MMRLAFMHRQLRGGGTEADLCRMAEGLVARGHEVHVFCARSDGAPAGVRLRRVPVLRAGRTARLLSFAVVAPRLVAREAFDVTVGFGRVLRQDVARVGGGTHRTYLRRMEAAGLRRNWRGPYHRAILWIERRAFGPPTRAIAVSERVRSEVCGDYPVAHQRVRVIYNGVDLERFHPRHRATEGAAVRAELGITPDESVCMAIGSGFARKGFDLLLRLWATARPAGARLVLVGDDERLARWRAQARAVDAGIVLTGRRTDVGALLAAADVVCVPSRQEAFGNVVLEACAAGVPVVTSRRVGAAEVFGGALGALTVEDPEDIDALGAALERALGADHPTLAAAARTLAERFPWARHLDQLEGYLAEVARGG